MGYESRLYIVNKSSMFNEDKTRYAQIVATFNMCVCPTTYKLQDFPETDCYIYGDDGNRRILEDNYGRRLTEAEIEDVIDLLEEDIRKGEKYRRLFPLLATLKVFEEQKRIGVWDENLVVLHYGY